jgi:hypothetical protein
MVNVRRYESYERLDAEPGFASFAELLEWVVDDRPGVL